MIPTITFKILKYSRGNYVQLFWGSTRASAMTVATGTSSSSTTSPAESDSPTLHPG